MGSRAYFLSSNSQLWGCESIYLLGTCVNMCMCLMSVGMGRKIISVVVEISLQVKEKTLRQLKESESNVCIRVGPVGPQVMIGSERALITFRYGPRGFGEVGG